MYEIWRIPQLELFHSPFRNIELRHVVSTMLRLGGGGFVMCTAVFRLREAACFNCAIPVFSSLRSQIWANVERLKNRLSHRLKQSSSRSSQTFSSLNGNTNKKFRPPPSPVRVYAAVMSPGSARFRALTSARYFLRERGRDS